MLQSLQRNTTARIHTFRAASLLLRRLTSTMNCPTPQPQQANGGVSSVVDETTTQTPHKPKTHTPTAITAPHAVRLACDHLRQHRVIALPTDTIYGLACCANSEPAIRRLYAIKGREQTKAVAICVASLEQLRHWGDAAHLPDELLRRLLPGPVTLVLRKRTEHLRNAYLNPGFEKIGVRIPDSQFIRAVCEAYALPLALTSANRSAAPSTLSVGEFEELWPALAVVFDGGAVGLTQEQRAGSTIVDLSERGACRVVRSGIRAAETLHVIGEFGIRVVGDDDGDKRETETRR